MNEFDCLHDLLEGMATNDPTLTAASCFSADIDDADAERIAEALRRNTRVTKLSLRWNHIGDDGARALTEALRVRNCPLVELNLGYNDIGADGARELAVNLFCRTSVLAALDLKRNGVGADGARALAEALPHTSSLAVLDLYHNNVGDDGARALAEALSRNSSLTRLGLSTNNVGDIGARALAEACGRNSSLVELSLEYNRIGDSGARAMAETMLPLNSSITALGLRGNTRIGELGLRAFVGALPNNSTVTRLDVSVSGNNERESEEEMNKFLECNKNEKKLMQAWTKMDFTSSSCPFLLSMAGKLCGLNTMHRIVRKRPDIFQVQL